MLDEPQGGPSKRPQTTTNGTTTTNCATDARRARISTKPLPHVERSPSRAGGKGAKACLGSSTGQTAHDLTGLKLAQPELLHEVLLGQSVQESAWLGPGQITRPGLAWPATEPGPRPSLVESLESFPTASWCLLGPPGACWGFLKPPWTCWGFLGHPVAS